MIILFSAPTGVKALKKANCTTDSITFNWQPPTPPNGKLSNYSIRISNSSNILRVLSTLDTELQVDGLKSFKTYRVRVRKML